MEWKPLPVGIDDFEKIVTGDYFYVDKTLFIKDLLDMKGEVNLFTRPRRFGKTLNMSMLQSFFEIGCDGKLFDGLAISEETALCEKYMGKFPVISISLKNVDGADYETSRALLCSLIVDEAMRFYDLLESSSRLNPVERRRYEQLVCAFPEKAFLQG